MVLGDERQLRETAQCGTLPFYPPESSNGVARGYARWITDNYRESFDRFAVSGILFNPGALRASSNFSSAAPL